MPDGENHRTNKNHEIVNIGQANYFQSVKITQMLINYKYINVV